MKEEKRIDIIEKTIKQQNDITDLLIRGMKELESQAESSKIQDRNTEGKLKKLEEQVSCGVDSGHRFTLDTRAFSMAYSNRTGTYAFRCIYCGLEYNKSKMNFNKREQDLLKAVLQE